MTRRIPYDQFLILMVLALLGVGLVMVFSASSLISREIYGSATSIFYRQLISVTLGLAIMLVVMKLDYHWFGHRVIVFGSILVVTALLIWALLSPGVNGVNRWIQLGPMRAQPSELAKLAVILLTSYFLVSRGGQIERPDRSLFLLGGAVGILVALILLEPDFGTSTSLLVTASLLLFLGGLRYRYYLLGLVLAAPAFYFLVYGVAYRRQRLLAFWDPEADPYGAGYQILQSLVAVGSGGLFGKGLAQGTQKLFYLPEPHTDFIFAVIGEETGLMGCCLVLLLFILFLWRGLRISLRADSLFGTYLGLGIVSMIFFQALFNISVVLSLCPTKGIPLPFISVGGSSSIVMLAGVGILLSISRQARPHLSAPGLETQPEEAKSG